VCTATENGGGALLDILELKRNNKVIFLFKKDVLSSRAKKKK
jgi:hypothetical protein